MIYCNIPLVYADTGTGDDENGPSTNANTIITKIDNWKTDVQTVLNSAVLIFAVVGGFLIFMQYMQGNEQAQKNLIRYVIGMGIFGLSTLVANVFLGTTST